MPKLRTHYDNLQVSENASIEVIKGAYKYLTQKYHPDRHPNDRLRATRATKIINQAYAVLSDPEKRREHDAWIKEQRKAREDQENRDAHEKGEEDAKKSDDYGHYTTEPPRDDLPVDESRKFIGGRYHPWRRWLARLIDLAGLAVLISFILGVASEYPPLAPTYELWMATPDFAWGVIVALINIPIEAMLISQFGTTPAKWLFGISVLLEDGRKPPISVAFRRALDVFARGCGCYIVGLGGIMALVGYYRLLKRGTTYWDTTQGTVVFHKKWSYKRALAATTAALMFFVTPILVAILIPAQEAYLQESRRAAHLHQLAFENGCDRPVGMVVRYSDENGVWRTDGWWGAKPGEVIYLTNGAGEPLVTNAREWYFYAITTEGAAVEWRGEHEFAYQDQTIPMARMTGDAADRAWFVTCD